MQSGTAQALDADNAKAALVKLIEATESGASEPESRQSSGSESAADRAAPKKKVITRAVLETMKVPSLVKLLRKLEVTEEEIDELLATSEVVKTAIIEKILLAQGGGDDGGVKAEEAERKAEEAERRKTEEDAEIRARAALKKATCDPEECARLAPFLREALAPVDVDGNRANGIAMDATDGQVLLEIERGAAMDTHGWNAMHRATQRDEVDQVKALVHLGIPLGQCRRNCASILPLNLTPEMF
eukprot:SAG31_NODE_343_length_17426_cov_35.294443_3_plen_244_part_00